MCRNFKILVRSCLISVILISWLKRVRDTLKWTSHPCLTSVYPLVLTTKGRAPQKGERKKNRVTFVCNGCLTERYLNFSDRWSDFIEQTMLCEQTIWYGLFYICSNPWSLLLVCSLVLGVPIEIKQRECILIVNVFIPHMESYHTTLSFRLLDMEPFLAWPEQFWN